MDVTHKHTFFLFIRDSEGDIVELAGPLFDDEVEQFRVEQFGNRHDVESMDEETFKILYADDYLSDFNINWADYVACLFDKLKLDFDIVAIGLDDEPDEDADKQRNFSNGEELIMIYDLCVIKKEEETLCIQFHFESDSTAAAEMILALNKYCSEIFELVILKPSQEEIDQYYKDKLKMIYLN